MSTRIPREQAEAVARIMREAAPWFTCDGDDEDGITYTSRTYGDVGTETPGRQDVDAAKAAIARINAEVSGVVAEGDTVDEWTFIEVTSDGGPRFVVQGIPGGGGR